MNRLLKLIQYYWLMIYDFYSISPSCMSKEHSLFAYVNVDWSGISGICNINLYPQDLNKTEPVCIYLYFVSKVSDIGLRSKHHICYV